MYNASISATFHTRVNIHDSQQDANVNKYQCVYMASFSVLRVSSVVVIRTPDTAASLRLLCAFLCDFQCSLIHLFSHFIQYNAVKLILSKLYLSEHFMFRPGAASTDITSYKLQYSLYVSV